MQIPTKKALKAAVKALEGRVSDIERNHYAQQDSDNPPMLGHVDQRARAREIQEVAIYLRVLSLTTYDT